MKGYAYDSMLSQHITELAITETQAIGQSIMRTLRNYRKSAVTAN